MSRLSSDANIKAGSIRDIGRELSSIKTGVKLAFIYDANILEEAVKDCQSSMLEAGFDVAKIKIAGGEGCKNIEKYQMLISLLIDEGISRDDMIVVMGGGALCDLAGFVAASYLRGIDYVQIPSTLLAMVDSSIGGKTGINIDKGKNLIGAFHTPRLVFRDIKLLRSLDPAVFWDGFGEVIKYAMLSKPVYELVAGQADAGLDLEAVISECARFKYELISEDFEDRGIRKILNFGHTLGHAIEKASKYEVSHGMAVVMGMALMFRISAGEGWCDESIQEAFLALIDEYDYDASIDCGVDELIEYVKADKKRSGDYIDIVIPCKMNECKIKRLLVTELASLIERYIR